MKEAAAKSNGKGRIRSLNRKGVVSGKSVGEPQREPSVCAGCGAVFARKTWRRNHRLSAAALAVAPWTTCPACKQVRSGRFRGRVVARGAGVEAKQEAIERRLRKVAERAEFTQPEHRLVSVKRDGAALEILTTSQKLAHRIAHEMKKAFGGRATYAWSDRDGSLLATWSYSGKSAG